MADTTTTNTMQQTTHEDGDTSSRRSLIQKLGDAEKYWTWKAGLRAIVCVINIVAIGATGWIMSNAALHDGYPYYGYSGFPGWEAGAIAILCASFIWCFLWILIPLVLKPPRPLHPGIAVGLDLCFWLGFLVIGLFTVATVVNTIQSGSDRIGSTYSFGGSSSGREGYYYLEPSNNTWIYNATAATTSDNGNWIYNATTGDYTYETVPTEPVVRDCTPEFTTCAEQDALINAIWRQRPRLVALTVLVNVVEWLDVLIHFALFVWACVDTNRYNRRGLKGREQIVADRIIADLENKGLITVRNGVILAGSGGAGGTAAGAINADALGRERTGRPEMVQSPPMSMNVRDTEQMTGRLGDGMGGGDEIAHAR